MPKWLQYYIGGGGSLGTPKKDYVICARPLIWFLRTWSPSPRALRLQKFVRRFARWVLTILNCNELKNFFHHFISNFDQPYFSLVQSLGGTKLRCCNLDPGILPILSTQVQKKKITISGKNAKDLKFLFYESKNAFSPFSCATFSSAENNTECEYCVSGYKKSVISIPSAHPPFTV